MFEECNPSVRTVNAFIFAARREVGGFVAQLAEARVAHGAFGCNDLMSVLIGANDVIDLFETVSTSPTPRPARPRMPSTNELTHAAPARRAITALTANNGPNIIVSTIPLMNQTPYGAASRRSTSPASNVLNVLNEFSTAFNTALRTNIPNDGSRWGWWSWMPL